MVVRARGGRRVVEANALPVTDDVVIRTAALPGDTKAWGQMRQALWPDELDVGDVESLHAAIEPMDGSCVLLAVTREGEAIGFAEAKLRRDYVNGTESSPVGFLEGWYVAPAWRGKGVGRSLIDAVEHWTATQGCSELASDALLDNEGSHAAHLGCGFEETDRVVYFRKRVSP